MYFSLLWPCPHAIARGRAFRYYSGTKPKHNGLTGVTAAIPHAFTVSHVLVSFYYFNYCF